MDEFTPAARDGETADPYDGVGETEYYRRMYQMEVARERAHFSGAEVEPW